MEETRPDSTPISERKKPKITTPFIATLIGVLIMVIALFLPYMTAVGDMAEYIEKYPDRVEIESLEMTASDLANVPVISVSNIITGVYGEDDGQIANIIVIVCSICVLSRAIIRTVFFKSKNRWCNRSKIFMA